MASWRLISSILQLRQQPAADLGPGHADVGDLAAEVGAEVGVAVAVLGFEAFDPGVVEDGAEAADLVAGDSGAVVDDEAGDDLGGVLPEDAALGLVDGEAFILGDVADAGPSGSRPGGSRSGPPEKVRSSA